MRLSVLYKIEAPPVWTTERASIWRSGWDSNPRAVARKLISSQVVKTELGGI